MGGEGWRSKGTMTPRLATPLRSLICNHPAHIVQKPVGVLSADKRVAPRSPHPAPRRCIGPTRPMIAFRRSPAGDAPLALRSQAIA